MYSISHYLITYCRLVLELPDGHQSTRTRMLFEVHLGSCKMHFPISAWKDSCLLSRITFKTHDSEPYWDDAALHKTREDWRDLGFTKITTREKSSTGFINNRNLIWGWEILPHAQTINRGFHLKVWATNPEMVGRGGRITWGEHGTFLLTQLETMTRGETVNRAETSSTFVAQVLMLST